MMPPVDPPPRDRFCPCCNFAALPPDNVCGACRAHLWAALRTSSPKRWAALLRYELENPRWDIPDSFVWLSLTRSTRALLPQWWEQVVWWADGVAFRAEHDVAVTVDGATMPLPSRPWHVAWRDVAPGWRQHFLDHDVIPLVPAQFGGR